MAGKILVIRGGAIGDFILTLPAIRLIREAFPANHLEILGYRHIVEVAECRFYADAVRSIEYGPLAGFFHPTAFLNPELVEYFASFNQVISYLFDPDEIFAGNLRKAGVKNLLVGPGKLDDTAHAAAQLAAPLTRLGLFLDDFGAKLFPSAGDFAQIEHRLRASSLDAIVMHPGSGSEKKNWPLEKWTEFIVSLRKADPARPLVLVGGEADKLRLDALRQTFGDSLQVIDSAPLPVLSALFSRCAGFVGHDSGISHIAAASGARCVLMFGPTDPHVWAPQNRDVQWIQSPSGVMDDIALESVLAVVDTWRS